MQSEGMHTMKLVTLELWELYSDLSSLVCGSGLEEPQPWSGRILGKEMTAPSQISFDGTYVFGRAPVA